MLRSQQSALTGRESHNDPRPAYRPIQASTYSSFNKHQIYKQWLGSGKRHNIVCTKCHRPDNLMLCSSCCRSYHSSCLSPNELPSPSQHFHCPGCQSGHLHRTLSPETSRSATPTVQGTARGVLSPSGLGNNVSPAHPMPWSGQTTGASTPSINQTTAATPLSGAFDPSILTRAQQFLLAHGNFSDCHEFPPDLLLKLGSMMAELDDHRARAHELMSENAHLRQDNANLRAYLHSNLAMGRLSAYSGGDQSAISRPSPDTSGKSWDRIVMDLI